MGANDRMTNDPDGEPVGVVFVLGGTCRPWPLVQSGLDPGDQGQASRGASRSRMSWDISTRRKGVVEVTPSITLPRLGIYTRT
jgi:hypothetical protein